MAKLFIVLSFFVGSLTFAQTTFPTNHCMAPGCGGAVFSLKPLSPSNMTPDIRLNLQKRAEELSQIWGDTILEGDYYAEATVRLDKIEELYQNDRFAGYRITYSSKAWDTSTCQFDSSNLATLQGCDEGRIVESGYISADFKKFKRDPKAISEFRKGAL